ncbi:4790_t:CDS:2 [Ambispora gerdemannii]|uniref:4790_t:CDS:1 n=1 Tax=Ambispora gerdemannii TaxID=144530 RepID=A0A9N8V0R1_9GLOM|nr:4790_t:CDS:2 [Ambispora gerdemannii]
MSVLSSHSTTSTPVNVTIEGLRNQVSELQEIIEGKNWEQKNHTTDFSWCFG